VTQTGKVSEVALGDDGYVKAIKKCAKVAGLDPAEFSGHSLRAGFLTSAGEHGASTFKLQEVSRHKSVDVLAGYVRRAIRVGRAPRGLKGRDQMWRIGRVSGDFCRKLAPFPMDGFATGRGT
jgi:integrase